MNKNHDKYPLQSTDLCLMNVMPWNELCWDVEDTSYVSHVLLNKKEDNVDIFGCGTYETIVLLELQPDLMFSLDLFIPSGGNITQYSSFVCFLAQMGFASTSKVNLGAFFQHAINQNIITSVQRWEIEKYLEQ